MKTHRQPGWYCDALPTGEWASLVANSHLDTDKGRINLPGENVLQFRLSRDGQIAGQGQTDQTQLWQNGQWSQLGLCISQDGHAWDEQNRLLACREIDYTSPDPSLWKIWHRYEHDGSVTKLSLATGAIGIRQVLPDGTIILAWKSYADPTRGLWGYTDYGDVAIGQGKESGCVVRFADDGILRLVEPGNCQFVRVNRDGDNWSIAIWRLDTKESVFYWFTTEELRMLDPVPVSLPPLGRTIGIGYFFRDSQQYGDNESAPGTHSVIADEPRALPAEGGLRMVLGLPCLLHEHLTAWWPLVDAVYVAAEGDLAQLERDAALARYIMQWRGLGQRPVLAYTAGVVFPDALTSTDIIGIQAYAAVEGEDPQAFQARMSETLSEVRHRRVALICQAYDRARPQIWTGERLATLQPVYWELARQFPNIEYLLLFSDGRRGGTRDNPEMRPWHEAMVAANG